MRAASIPSHVLLSALVASICTIALPTTCEAFVPLTANLRAEICNTSSRLRRWENSSSCIEKSNFIHSFLKNANNDNEFSIDSIDEIESRISAMKVIELRAELKSHGEPTTGLKKVLQQRLLDYYHGQLTTVKETNRIKDPVNLADHSDDINDDEDKEKETRLEIEDEDKDVVGDSEIYVFEDEDESLPSGLLDSKQKWKKKTYLLMEDVRKLVHSKDPMIRQRAPKKAGDAVRRIQRWISLSSLSTGMKEGLDIVDDDSEDDADGVQAIIDLDSDSVSEFQKFQRSSLLRAYNLWIHAIAKSGFDDAGNQAEHVLLEMQKNTSNGGPAPNEITIASVMDAHAHSASMSSSKGGAKAAENFLFELLDNHGANHEDSDMPWSQEGENSLRNSLIVTCDTMLNALAREGTRESAERAQVIVLRLEDYQRQKEKQNKKNRSKNSRTKSTLESDMAIESTNSRKRPISYATGTLVNFLKLIWI